MLDPIDGTKSFIHGVPLSLHPGGPVLEGETPCIGVIHAPALGEMRLRRRGPRLPGTSPMAIRRCRRSGPVSPKLRVTLQDGLLLTSEIALVCRRASAPPTPSTCTSLHCTLGFLPVRTWADGYGYLMVATGRAEVMIDPAMKLWDVAPLPTVIEEAGGTFTDWHGQPTIYAGECHCHQRTFVRTRCSPSRANFRQTSSGWLLPAGRFASQRSIACIGALLEERRVQLAPSICRPQLATSKISSTTANAVAWCGLKAERPPCRSAQVR